MKAKKFADYDKVEITGRLRVCVEFAKKQKLRDKVILDIGCANGLMAYLLLPQKPKKYFGADPSEKAIEFAKKHVSGAKFYVAPASKIPLKNNIADVALMFDVIEHVPKNTEIEALGEINRILKKGGKIVLSTPHNHFITNLLDPAWYFGHRHYTSNQVKEYLKMAGFKNITVEVRGGLWFSIYLILLYISKWLFGQPEYKNNFIQSRDDKQFSSRGIHTIYATAQKI